MKKGVKGTLIVVVILLVAGIGLTIGGIAAGAVKQAAGLENGQVKGWFGVLNKYKNLSEELPKEPLPETVDGDSVNRSVPRILVPASKNITDLYVEADVADVEIYSIDDFEFVGKEIDGNMVTEGTIVVEMRNVPEEQKVDCLADAGEMRLTVECQKENLNQLLEMIDSDIVIYLPHDRIKNLSVHANVGDVEIENGFSFDYVDICTDTGDVELGDNIRVNTSLCLKSSVGNLEAEGLECLGNAEASSSVGDVSMHFSELAGNLNVETGTGQVDLMLLGKPESYNYDLSAKIGSLSCGDVIYGTHGDEDSHHAHGSGSGFDSQLQLTNTPQGSTITVKTEVGDIEIDFN